MLKNAMMLSCHQPLSTSHPRYGSILPSFSPMDARCSIHVSRLVHNGVGARDRIGKYVLRRMGTYLAGVSFSSCAAFTVLNISHFSPLFHWRTRALFLRYPLPAPAFSRGGLARRSRVERGVV